jgi:hypothetical protein
MIKRTNSSAHIALALIRFVLLLFVWLYYSGSCISPTAHPLGLFDGMGPAKRTALILDKG